MFTTEFRREWIHRFSAHLMKLLPWMNAVVAVQHAVAAFKDGFDTDPILAAAMAARGESAACAGLTQHKPQAAPAPEHRDASIEADCASQQ